MTKTESLCHPSLLSKFTTLFTINVMLLFGYITEVVRDYLGYTSKIKPRTRKGYAPLYDCRNTFFMYSLYDRCQDMCNKPLAGRPDRIIQILDRKRHHVDSRPHDTVVRPEKYRKNLNFGSYNYLGLSKTPPHIETHVLESLERFGVSSGGTRQYAYNTVVRDLEKAIASYVGKEDALIMGMGYATNSMMISTFIGEGDLILCDKLSHSSSWTGFKSSKAEFHSWIHNDAEDLEKQIRKYISQGQPGSTRDNTIPWKRIWVMFEGIYSMEGEFPPLKEIVKLKEKYGVYLYMDEAHSMGGTGRTGRGACEVAGVSPKDVDILMGTFTKAFGSVGGYIASSRHIIRYLKEKSIGTKYGSVIPPTAAMQAVQCHRMMVGMDGTNEGKRRIKRQRKNAVRLYRKLKKIGVEVMGQEGSPVLCIMLYNMAKMVAFSRLTYKRGLAVCTCGFPATALLEMRARLCVSAQHTEKDVDNCVEIINDVAELMLLKYNLPWYKRIWNILT